MKILDRPFTRLTPGDLLRPWLPIVVVNPDSGYWLNAYALIDTGADDCALPAHLAPMLGYRLRTGRARQISTGSGAATAYAHKIRIEIPDQDFASPTFPIDFMPGLAVPLLGVASFLSRFKLTVDYPRRCFSLREPATATSSKPRRHRS